MRYKKWWIIGGSVFAGLLILGGIIAWNILSWADYEQKYTSWHSQLRTKTDVALALPAKTPSDREKKRSSLGALGGIINEGKSHCDRYKIIHWQQFIPQVKERIDACNQIRERSGRFAIDMNIVVGYLDAEQGITRVLAKGIATKLDEGVMKQQPQVWLGIEKEVGVLDIPERFVPVRQLAVVKAAAVREAWQLLVAANDAKDRAKYEEATDKLAAAYGAFGEITDLSEKTFVPLVASLEKSYQQAF